ncbi:MAG: MFS transporter [Chloroflexi bacterium]|nr:MFS transporter [Chloroflexota bacterium]MBP7041934.1 MFS transporter [Chloroflexota bacterium]
MELDVSVDETVEVETAVADAFQTNQVMTIAGGHFVHDTYTAFISPLLPVLQQRLSVGYAMAGSLAIFAQLPSLFNPFIGYLADKANLRWFIILAPAVTATLMSSMGLTPTYLSLALLLLASGISIACFHAPAPAMIAKISGKRVGKGMSVFMASGELGRTVGPVVAAAGVAWWGLEGMWRLMFVGWAVSVILYFRLRHVAATPARDPAQTALASMWPTARRVFFPLIWIMTGGMLLQVALTTYLPLFMSDVLQVNLWLAAASLTILQAAGVVGALISGTVSDKYGRQRILFIVLVVAPLLLLAFLYGPSWLAVPLLLALGLTVLSPQPVFLAIVQDQFPHHRALANGSYLAVNFLIRAAAIWIVGLLADQYGLPTAFLVSGLAAFISLPALRYLPPEGRL